MKDKFISIVLPIYNQSDHIKEIVDRYEERLSQIPNPHEIILVPNGCTDNSEDICRDLSGKYPSVKVKTSIQGGWGLAVKLGLKESEGDLLCYTNSARTSSEDLMLILLYAIANPDVIIKSERKVRDQFIRRLGSLLYNLECRSLFDLPYWDINGTPKAFPRKFDKLLNLKREDDLIDLEFTVICQQESYPVLEVPILKNTRHGGISTTKFRSAFKLYRGAFQMWKSLQQNPK